LTKSVTLSLTKNKRMQEIQCVVAHQIAVVQQEPA